MSGHALITGTDSCSRVKAWASALSELWNRHGVVDYEIVTDDDVGPETLCGHATCRSPALVVIRPLTGS